MEHKLFISFFLISTALSIIRTEFYSSIDHMTGLIFTQRELVSSLQDYIAAEGAHIEKLKRCLRMFENVSKSVPSHPETYMSNPVTAYKFVRRLRNAWIKVEELAHSSPSKEFLSLISAKSQRIPDDTDLDGITLGLLRLQETYKLPPEKMRALAPTAEEFLDPDDSFHVARVAHENHKFLYAFLWMQDAHRQLDEGKAAGVSQKEVLRFLAHFAFQMGELPLAFQLTKDLLDLDPSDDIIPYQLAYYQRLRESVQRWHSAPAQVANFDIFMPSDKRNIYEALCRGDGEQVTSRRQRALSCRYSTGGGNPRLIYAPIKEEEEWAHPHIIRYHDLLSDMEIDIIKNISRLKLQRAMVLDKETGKRHASEDRVSKSAWLSEKDDGVVARISQRIADATGLEMETAEDLQVANYGIGGQYEPHYDSKLPNDTEFLANGGRIATVLIYMSDVEMGGATVFPLIGAALKPKKGSAVFWYNLLRNGQEDERTLHAACPVLTGSKWVSNIWIRERGQEFKRRCGLSQSD
ncbi:prolyl 4-hydroxylase subunit alpha-2-like [Brienomyrus brachyistius]|uniref:prolyl 4-hydroxylase subunit alpha-2-like n=1 Tax=Brienomyrus brachyistius TaxID=42636 RepID=UPI0020B1E3E3|nr:prolyl 4-hydroxylase subunit alpha-2-like [Brienomyrus brachyistius]